MLAEVVAREIRAAGLRLAAEFMGANNRLAGESAGKGKLKIGDQVFEGIARGETASGATAIGVIRLERVRIADVAGPNRVKLELNTQMYLGERFELVFTLGKTPIRAYAERGLSPGTHFVEFPREALWIFPQAAS